ncbi:unnamed protein product [Schistosoma margrebowiei]|nr:unnamed protein product [Schistosoma margrebowiei]
MSTEFHEHFEQNTDTALYDAKFFETACSDSSKSYFDCEREPQDRDFSFHWHQSGNSSSSFFT